MICALCYKFIWSEQCACIVARTFYSKLVNQTFPLGGAYRLEIISAPLEGFGKVPTRNIKNQRFKTPNRDRK